MRKKIHGFGVSFHHNAKGTPQAIMDYGVKRRIFDFCSGETRGKFKELSNSQKRVLLNKAANILGLQITAITFE